MFVNERAFREFLKKSLKDSTIRPYISNLKKISNLYKDELNKPILDVTSLVEFEQIRQTLDSNKNFSKNNSDRNGAFATALNAYLKFLNYADRVDLFAEDSEDLFVGDKKVNLYTKENFLEEVFISEEKYNLLVNLLEHKKNIILQGAPGVGKTFAAKRLAYSILGEKNDDKIEFVQFHQNYSYEDFIMGWRPAANGFELRTGIFYEFCKKAEENPNEKFFFIIDEINRGNLSKIFGELLMLIERGHRGEKIRLAYNGEEFSVPENIFIIGMMNTADRSLAIIDYALRRRFSFVEMLPAFDSDGFKKYQSALHNETFDKLIEQIKKLNAEISDDNSLGRGFCIGHSYFCDCDEKNLRSIVDYEILPMLEEYFFDDGEKFQSWENILRGVFND